MINNMTIILIIIIKNAIFTYSVFGTSFVEINQNAAFLQSTFPDLVLESKEFSNQSHF